MCCFELLLEEIPFFFEGLLFVATSMSFHVIFTSMSFKITNHFFFLFLFFTFCYSSVCPYVVIAVTGRYNNAFFALF